MNRPNPQDRPTARQLAMQAQGEELRQIAGKPANVCPYCGAAMFANGTQVTPQQIYRYVVCRNCQRSFLSKQPPATLVREVSGDSADSSSGNLRLTILKTSA